MTGNVVDCEACDMSVVDWVALLSRSSQPTAVRLKPTNFLQVLVGVSLQHTHTQSALQSRLIPTYNHFSQCLGVVVGLRSWVAPPNLHHLSQKIKQKTCRSSFRHVQSHKVLWWDQYPLAK